MTIGVAYLGIPLLLFAGLAALPSRVGVLAVGFGLVAVVLAGAWLGFGGDPGGFGTALVIVWGGAALAAGLAQGLRVLLPAGRPGWVYPLVVVAVLLAVGVPALTVLGM